MIANHIRTLTKHLMLAGLILLMLAGIAVAEERLRVAAIQITINPIFSEEERTGWLYETADQLHIDTRPYVIRRLLPFKEGDTVSRRQLQETERILRRQAFIRDARVTWSNNAEQELVIAIETWENWTLIPTVDVNREGGITEYSYGIQDENLLGHGLRSTILYFKEQQRTGYSLVLASQVVTEHHLQTALALSDTSDGEQYSMGLRKPFFTLDDRWGMNLFLNSERREDSIYSNDQEVNSFEHEIEHLELSYGFSEGLVDEATTRYRFGFTKKRDSFVATEDTVGLPLKRDFSYPWFGFEFIEDNFIKTRNLYLIGRTEDIQLGWSHTIRLGLDTGNTDYQKSLHWAWQSRFTHRPTDNQLYTTWVRSDGVDTAGRIESSYYYELGYEHFYHASSSRIWYGKIKAWGADNPFIDRPVAIGGESGLRGYPLQYQHGEHAFLVNLEKRYYPGLNLFKLVDVGFAGFIDVGRAQGETLYPNQEQGTLVSAGLGLRLFFSRSSGRNLVNVNIAAPVNSEFLSGVDVSITATASF